MFISKRRYQSASGISPNGLGSKMPTLFTSTSTTGSFAITDSAPAEPEKSSIGKSTLERFTLFVHLLNEVEQHDDMAYDDSNQAGYSKKCHEAKGCAHDCQSD